MIRQFVRIGGRTQFSPVFYSHIQTDGAYTKKAQAIALLLKSSDHSSEFKKVLPILAESSTEAEWASVYYGIQFALEHNEPTVALENDDFGVISALITNRALKHNYAKHYREKIKTIVGNTAWIGIRWIPREANKADDLFKK